VKTVPSLATLTVVSLVAISACSPKPATPATADLTAGASSAPRPESSHAVAAVASAGNSAVGPVLETMNASSYTYVRVKGATGDIWAASGTFKVAVGDMVVVPLENPMENFHSDTLKRDFPVIYFATSIRRADEPAGGAAASTAAAAPDETPAQVTEPIPPAPGGVSIASVVTGRKAMAGKTVTVRGKVVKYNGAILGFNWVHLQDGSGTAKDGSNDITVTTSSTAAVGDIVTITGTVVLDKDFGAGYNYAVLLQNASVTKK